MERELPTLNFHKILSDNIYEVPIFQRPYSWTNDELNEFWEDILICLQKNDDSAIEPKRIKYSKDKFIGLFIFINKDNKKIIIDGQQRMSNVLIFLSLIRSFLLKYSKDKSCKDLSESIFKAHLCETDMEGEIKDKKLKLGYYDKEFFEKYILENIEDINENILNMENYETNKNIKSYSLIKESYIFYKKKIEESLEGKIEESQKRFLKSLYYTIVKGLSMISFIRDSEEGANDIFETMNSRGKELSQSDLIKNYIFNQLDIDEVDENFEKWNKITENVGQNKINDFIKHHFVSKYELGENIKIKENLFSSIKRIVKEVEDYFQNLYDESYLFSEIFDYQYELGGPDKETHEKIKDIYSKITKWGINRIYPLILAGGNKFKMLQDKLNFLKLVNSFVVRYKILSENSPDKLLKTVNKLSIKLRNIDYSLNDFSSDLKSNDLSINDELLVDCLDIFGKKTNKRIMKVLLIELENYIRDVKGKHLLSFKRNISVEHLLPEKLEDLSTYNISFEDHKDSFWRIGNLLLVKSKTNKELGQKPFKEKLEILKEIDDIEIVKEFVEKYRDSDEWNKSKIMSRQDYLNSKIKLFWNLDVPT